MSTNIVGEDSCTTPSPWNFSRSIFSEDHWNSLEELQESSSDEEFYDAQENIPPNEFGTEYPCLQLSMHTDHKSGSIAGGNGNEPQFDKKVKKFRQTYGQDAVDAPADASIPGQSTSCPTQTLILVIHGGTLLDSNQEPFCGHQDLLNLQATFDSVIQSHYRTASSHIQLRLVVCPNLCQETLALLSSMSQYSCFSESGSLDINIIRNQSFVPLGIIPLLATGSSEYQAHVNTMVVSANQVYNEFLKSESGMGFSGQVCLLSDAIGSLLAYDALTTPNSPVTHIGPHYGSRDSLGGDAVTAEGSAPCSSPINCAMQGDNHIRQEVVKGDNLNRQEVVKGDNFNRLEVVKRDNFNRQEVAKGDNFNRQEVVKGGSIKQKVVSCSESERNKNQESLSSNISNVDFFRKKNLTRGKDSHGAVLPSQQAKSGNSLPGMSSTSEARVEKEMRRTSGESQNNGSNSVARFDFDVADFFMCGAPLGMVLAFRKMQMGDEATVPKPACHQVYNLFHSQDPTSTRLEPLLQGQFCSVSPVTISKYSRFPLGDGEPIHVVETVQKHLKLFACSAARDDKGSQTQVPPSSQTLHRQCSLSSVTSTSSGLGESTVSCIANVTKNWWGVKRVDYILYSPEALHTFPANALPHLFHSSFWESTDLVSFILRQVLKHREIISDADTRVPALGSGSIFKMKTPREKWLKRRTTIKVRNLQPNHRANDVIVVEGKPQVLTAKFMYGSLDIASLTGEKVDVNVMKQFPSGEWTLLGTKVTEKHGRFTFTIPEEEQLCQGLYPVKLVVRGDHTSADFFLAVLPPRAEAVIFSIDGSFTASVSIMGSDPKVRASAVDVVRHWQDLGYLILYISARPDLQHKKVVSWLAQHNFPHGLVAFMDGLCKDPLRQKFNYIRCLQTEAQLVLKAAYGSSKDISIYRELGLQPHRIFIVGKASKKQHSQAKILCDGYSAHLSHIRSSGFTRPASGTARLLLHRHSFRLSAQEHHRKDSKKHTRQSTTHETGGME